jgi:F420-dependent oxidoreductase-like protein
LRVRMMMDIQEGVSWAEWQAIARGAENAGLDGLFSSDHYSNFHSDRTGGLDVWATLAALAVETKRLRLGTVMTAVGFRHPSVLARMVATVDHISGGRVELGIGTGWVEVEHKRNGFPYPSMPERFDNLAEQLEIIVRTWTEDGWSHNGPLYHIEGQTGAPRPVQKPHPPVIMGNSAKPRSLALAARYAQEYNVVFCAPEECARVRGLLNQACEAAGRDPKTLRLSYMTNAPIGENEEGARDRLERVLETTRRGPHAGVPNHWLTGTVKQAAESLAPYAGAGVEVVYLQNHDHGNDEAIAVLGQLAREIA